MFDKDAIKALTEAQSINAAAGAVNDAIANSSIVALPSDYATHDLEKYLPNRRRARGKMATSSVQAFAAYVEAHKEEGASVFVSQSPMAATAVLNLGKPTAPGHADNIAELAPKATAAYIALCSIANGQGKTQRDVAEWLEDWAMFIDAVDSDGQDIQTKHAISAVRSITIEAMRKAESKESSLSATRSALEQVTARSDGNPLPAELHVNVEPYVGFLPRMFVVRLGVLTTNDKPSLVLRIAKAELHAEQMAAELAEKVQDALNGVPALLGNYAAR